MVLNAILDFFSLASFLPLIFLIVNPEIISSNRIIHYLYTAFNFSSPASFIIAFTGFILIFTLFKTMVALRITRSKANYCFILGSNLSSRMLSQYMEVSYLKFTQMDFTKELDRIANLPIAFANNIIMPLANLLSEGLVFFILLVCIALYDVKVFVMLTIILTPIGLVYLFKRKSLSQTSDELSKKYPLSLKRALQIVEGLVDIKAFGRESFFKTRFNQVSQDLAKTFARDHTNQTGASRLTEVIAAFIICSLILYAVVNNQNYQQTFLLLGIYTGASFRMIPSLNRILNSVLQIKSHHYLFVELDGLVTLKPDRKDERVSTLSFTHEIELRDLSFQYPDGTKVLDGTSLTIRKGEKIALVGKSGSGKTTMLLIFLQFLKGNAGKIVLDDVEISDDSLLEWRRIFSFVPQNPYLIDGTIVENIAFGFSPESVNTEKIQQLIRDVDLEEMISQLPNGLSTQIGEKGIKLSGGQRQRIAIARALYADAEVLLLDEITNQLDAQTELEIISTLEKITRQKKTILMITHHDHLLDEFDRILSLDSGKISEMKPARTSLK
jgi:ABC-type multidrug transport system fused ATPase/permease subunit